LILVDANLLVSAHAASLPRHAAARAWLASRLAGTARVGLAWPSVLAFVRLVSNPRVFERPEPVVAAWEQAHAWLASPAVWVPPPGDRHADILGPLLRTSGLRANDVPDAHLAALAIEHGLVLCTTDSGFARFPGLVWENPVTT
jgi:uncharacterized protein